MQIITQYLTADLRRKQFVITMRIKHTIGYKVCIFRSAFYPYIFDSLDFRSWVKRKPSPHFLVRKLPVDGPQVRSPHFTNARCISCSWQGEDLVTVSRNTAPAPNIV